MSNLFKNAAVPKLSKDGARYGCSLCSERSFASLKSLNDHREAIHSVAGIAAREAKAADKAAAKVAKAQAMEKARRDAIESQKRIEQERLARIALRASLSPREVMLLEALVAARSHLDYTGYGDSWERECADAQKLPDKINAAIAAAGGE